MARNALLIGSPYDGLTGPLPDVERIAELLENRGFNIRKCVDQDATREGIVTAYRSLIENTGSGDAVVVYYSGHGARSKDEDYTPQDETAPQKRYHHFIVPMDLSESSDGDFRGILSLELSSLLSQLTDKTRNVTVIFDCCHSGGMTRALGLRIRTLARRYFVGAHGHLERFNKGDVPGFPVDQIAVAGNPHAVRLMAALPSQSAWEYEGPGGAYGLMTDALITAFAESGDRPTTWNAINRRVRELVQRLEPGQYPDIEGPSSRFLFDLEEADLTGIVPVESSDDGLRIFGGRLLGIEKGDEYVIMPHGFQKAEDEHAIARAIVKYVGGAWSLVDVDPHEAAQNLPAVANAFPVSRAHHKRPVVIKAGAELQPALEAAVARSGQVRLPTNAEPDSSRETLAVVEEREGRIHIRERADLDLITPIEINPSLPSTVVENLERLARARTLETLESGTGPNELKADYQIDWGRVVQGTPRPLSEADAMMFVGDRLYLRVRNKSTTTLYVSVFDIGLAGKITLLTRNVAPSGAELEQDGPPFTLGYREPFGWKGLGPLSWPEQVPEDGEPRPESLVVIVTDRPQNLRALESPGMAAAKEAEAGWSELEGLVDQVATGRTRDLDADDSAPDVRYAVEHIQFFVDPMDLTIHQAEDSATRRRISRGNAAAAPNASEAVPAAAVRDVSTFLIDDRPDAFAVYRRARGPAPPTAVAIQLGEIVIHKNRALRSADVRVDALVVTGGKKDLGVYRSGTAKFDRIKDGDRLPLDNLLVYHGPATAFLDLAVWVSRDAKRSLSLADMLKEQVNSAEFREAALLLAGLAVAAPTAGAIVGGLGAATVITNIAYKLLSAAVGTSIGLYRTSLLKNENFGVGRHPVKEKMKAQDFSFWYQVKALD